MAYDIIGDVHGHANRLQALLRELGYTQRAGAWRHPDRTAIFVGDLIDRGPGQLETLQLVRAMMDAGSARAVMGNHEFNAIGWATPDPKEDGSYLRPRRGSKGNKNAKQHQAFLAAVGLDSDLHRTWTEWFLDLPLWIEEPEFRVVHACWSPQHAERLRPHLREGNCLTSKLIDAAHRPGTQAFEAVDVLLKGLEVDLPPGVAFTDKDGHSRERIRVRWWDRNATTYAQAYIGPSGVEMPVARLSDVYLPPIPDRPTFVGHYWLDADEPPSPLSDRVACVDYSAGKGGPLVAYRFDGESKLSTDRFVAV